MANLVCGEREFILVPQERRNKIRKSCSPAFFCVYLVKACLRDVFFVQGCSNFLIYRPEFLSISRRSTRLFTRNGKLSFAHIVHISNQMVALLFDLTILRQIPLKGQSMRMALSVRRLKKGSFPTIWKKPEKTVIEELLSKRGRCMVSSTELIWFSRVLLSECSVQYVG